MSALKHRRRTLMCACNCAKVTLHSGFYILRTGTEILEIGNVEIGNRKRGKEHVRDEGAIAVPAIWGGLLSPSVPY